VGAPGAIAEAILIAVAHALADEAGIKERVVGINSIGADDSSARYMRELGSYLRKYADMIPPALMQGITDDPLSVLMQLAEKKHPLVERAPQSMEYLNEDERRHLWAVLEYLEAAHVYYELNPLVLGSRDCWNHTLFEVHAIDPDTQTLVPFIRGGRYDALVRRSQNAGTCAVGMSIMCEVRGKRSLPTARAQDKAPSLYFAHLGPEAKRKSIPVLESLRRADIAVRHALTYDQIADQMTTAKVLGVPFMLIMGHKEAMEDTVLVRDTRTNAQYAVPASDLPGYLRKRHIGTH
jgi:histidyl-tRNA synthetase